jgi:DNA processing protein
MLSTLGSIDILASPMIAVIGSRQPSYFGLQQSFLIGKELSSLALTVVSGGALGCDIAVHQGVMSSGSNPSQACVVFAGGLSRLYPRRHGSIFDQILERGGLFLSERPWYQGCQKRDFPIRNRIVSGMSEAVIVSQAAIGSGSLITAHEALEQGRDVYVLKHNDGDVRAQGSEQLLEDGAIAFSNVAELVEYLVHLPQSPEMDWNIRDNDDGACQMPSIIGTVEIEHHIN